MLKLCPVLLVIGFIYFGAEGKPFGFNDISAAAARGDWGAFQRLLQDKFESMHRRLTQGPENFVPDFSGIRELQPQGPHSHVYGEAEYSYKSSVNQNGKQIEKSGGRRIVNKDGVIQEYETH